MTHDNGRGRPRQESGPETPAKKSIAILVDSVPARPVPAATEADATAAPCRRCGHPLTAPKSVARLLGPVCLLVVGGERR